MGKRSALPPLGLLTVAALLPPEWSVRLVDTNVRGLTDKDLAWADCVFVSAMVGMLQAPAGTRLYARMVKERTTNILPVMGLQALKDGYRQILDHIYAPAPYCRRIRTFPSEYRPSPARGKIEFSHVLALLRSFCRLGIVGKERFEYWRLLFWTQFRRPRLLPDAVILAIYGHHFRRVCERHVT